MILEGSEEHLLAWPLLRREGYDEGRLVLLAPALNEGWVAAGRAYQDRLTSTVVRAAVPFGLVTLEAALAAAPGGAEAAAYLRERYLAFGRVHRLVLGADLPPLPGPGPGGRAADEAPALAGPAGRRSLPAAA
jgi:hypothetical protein